MMNKDVVLTLILSPDKKQQVSNAELSKFVTQVKTLCRRYEIKIEVRRVWTRQISNKKSWDWILNEPNYWLCLFRVYLQLK